MNPFLHLTQDSPKRPPHGRLVVGSVKLQAIGVLFPAIALLTACGSLPGIGTGGGHRSRPGQLVPSDYETGNLWDDDGYLNSRTRDPYPLTELEVFGIRKTGTAIRPHNGSSRFRFILQGPGQLDSDCGQTVWGDRLKAALRSYGCTQVVRGVYADPSKLIVGHAAVFNLRNLTSANKLLKDLNPARHQGFLKPLPSQEPPVDRFGTGYTGAGAGAFGHFVIVSWIGYSNGAEHDSDKNIYQMDAWCQDSRLALESAFIGFADARNNHRRWGEDSPDPRPSRT